MIEQFVEGVFLISMAALMFLFVYVALSEGHVAWYVWTLLALAAFTLWAGVMVMRG